MSSVGTPTDWIDLIDNLVPDILDLVVGSWNDMAPLALDAHENPTTEALCRLLRLNRNSSELPFQIQIQMVELDPAADQDQGRMDITFCPLVPRENIYFSLECKRLHVTKNGKFSSYATEYVVHGMMRFVQGQYAAIVRHGGMLGYVLDDNWNQAIQNVRSAIKKGHVELGMSPPGDILQSSIRPNNPQIRETTHTRKVNPDSFQIHHIFMPRPQCSALQEPNGAN